MPAYVFPRRAASSPSSTITVANTAVGILLGSMASDSWAELTVPSQLAALSDFGNSKEIIPYMNSGSWNSFDQRLEIMGRDHGTFLVEGDAYPKLVYYTASNNTYTIIRNPATEVAGDSHGYDHTCLNPYTGDLYRRKYGGGDGSTPFPVYRKLRAGTTFTQITNPPPYATDVAIGIAWCNAGFLGSGAQGCLVHFTGGRLYSNQGVILAFDPLLAGGVGAWFYNQNNRAPGMIAIDNYHHVCEYSGANNVLVYGGGNRSANQLWKMDSSGTVTTLVTTPVPVGTNNGGMGNFVAGPNGNFFAMYNGQLWELNPAGTGTWTQRANPPSGVNYRDAIDTHGGVILSSLGPDYNALMAISMRNDINGATHLYKL